MSGVKEENHCFGLEQIGTNVNIAGGHAEYMVAYADATQLLLDCIKKHCHVASAMYAEIRL